MNAKKVLGKRIVAVRQEQFWDAHNERMAWSVNALVLEDGTYVYFFANEAIDMPYVSAWTETAEEQERRRQREAAKGEKR